jgi:chemotaxis protein methyltransferase WspC
VLSIPCATGEEAYSMAMALDGIGMPAESYQIDAVDISEQALALARRAIYSKNSFRSKNLDFRDRYFKAGPHGYHLVESIRRQVLFQQRNLLSPDFFPGSHSFHFIFCRNLLIYLDQSAQDRAIRALKRLLAPEGVLFVGPAEAALMFNHDLVSIKRPMAFAFRQVKAIVVPPKQPTRQKTVSLRSKPAAFAPPVFKSRPHLKTQRVSITRSKSLLSGKIGADLKLAHRLADEGRLEEAIKACNNYLKEHSSSVEALHLLGVICEAKGDRERAGGYFRKVLYLNPEHHESLMHLAYSAEKEGNISAAQNLRARAQRVKERRPHV